MSKGTCISTSTCCWVCVDTLPRLRPADYAPLRSLFLSQVSPQYTGTEYLVMIYEQLPLPCFFISFPTLFLFLSRYILLSFSCCSQYILKSHLGCFMLKESMIFQLKLTPMILFTQRSWPAQGKAALAKLNYQCYNQLVRAEINILQLISITWPFHLLSLWHASLLQASCNLVSSCLIALDIYDSFYLINKFTCLVSCNSPAKYTRG